MVHSKLTGRGARSARKERLAKTLSSTFEEDPLADKLNLTNEKELNRVMTKIIKQNQKRAKPIDTRILLKK